MDETGIGSALRLECVETRGVAFLLEAEELEASSQKAEERTKVEQCNGATVKS